MLFRMRKKYLVAGLMMLLLAGPQLLAQAVADAQGTPAPGATPQTTATPQAESKGGWKWPLFGFGSKSHEAQPAPDATGSTQGVALRNGDAVDIRLSGVPPEDVQQFSATYTVDELGMINLPYIGMIKAGGLPPSQVQVQIQNKLISDGIYTNPSVTVNPPPNTRYISVVGAVRGPGRQIYTSDLTLMTAISTAGGASDFAGDKIRLIRGGKVEFFSRKKLDKDPSLDPRIEPGDQIEILESWW